MTDRVVKVVCKYKTLNYEKDKQKIQKGEKIKKGRLYKNDHDVMSLSIKFFILVVQSFFSAQKERVD